MKRRPLADSFLVVGGGLVGLAVARQLLLCGKGVHLLEKETEVGQHQSTHNSGVLHAGLYYKPGSLKAALAVRGIRLMTAFCREHGIAHEICGKLVVATSPGEIPRLKELLERGERNGLRGLRWLEGAEIRSIEPAAAGVAAVHVPEEGIVDYSAVCGALKAEILRREGRITTGARVFALARSGGEWRAETTAGGFCAPFLVNAAGLHCDRVCRMAGGRPQTRILPFRGEYYRLGPRAQPLVRNLIYPVPDPAFPFLGVHFTRMIAGGVEAGPNAILAFAREGYRKSDLNPGDLAEALAYPGLWRFLAAHPRMCAQELAVSFSRERFCRSLQRLVPDLVPSDLEPGGAGVRAQAISREGRLEQDFQFVHDAGALHILNAPSPGATASLAIGEAVVREIEERGGEEFGFGIRN